MPTLSVQIDSEIIGELYLRAGKPDADITALIQDVLYDYLERTANDEWSESYHIYRLNNSTQDEFGEPKGGYHWTPIFLPNGTLIRMEYKREISEATVKYNKIEFKGENYTPSELARFIANGTNRNAWRDLLIKRPSDTDWCLADDLRRRVMK